MGSALKMLERGFGSSGKPFPARAADPHSRRWPLFERVLINLLENAIKYAGPQAQIGIDAHVEDEHLQLDVWDNGPGIPQGQEQRVFDKFSRGTKSQRCRASGWGWPFVGR